MECNVRDEYVIIQKIRNAGYSVPSSIVRLFIPQTNFQSNKLSSAIFDKYGFLFNLKGTNYSFIFLHGYRERSNLPIFYVYHNGREYNAYTSIESSVM